MLKLLNRVSCVIKNPNSKVTHNFILSFEDTAKRESQREDPTTFHGKTQVPADSDRRYQVLPFDFKESRVEFSNIRKYVRCQSKAERNLYLNCQRNFTKASVIISIEFKAF